MTGTPTPRSRSFRRMSGTAAAAASLLTVTRTSSLPACASCATWIAVASGSAVSVFVIDWTTTGGALPTGTPPTSTVTVLRRVGLSRSADCALVMATASASATESGDVERRDPDEEREQQGEADHVGQPLDPEAQARAHEALEEQHEDPPAVERRQRQDVDHGEVRGQDPGQVEGDDRAEGPEHVADLARDTDWSPRRRRLGRVGDDARGELTDAAEDQARRGNRPLPAQPHRLAGGVANPVLGRAQLDGDRREDDVSRVVRDARSPDAEGALAVGDLLGGAQRRGEVGRAAIGVANVERDGAPGLRPKVLEDDRRAEGSEGLSVDALDHV